MNPLRLEIEKKERTPAVIDLVLEETEDLDVELQENDELSLSFGSVGNLGASSDYLTLINKPSINGTTLVNNYNEIDPTVPAWAKTNTKPTYTAEETGSIDINDEMSLTTVKGIWDTYFN